MMEQTNCDGVMIGRGAQGNPWIFHQIKTYLETGMVPEKPPFSEVCRMILRAMPKCRLSGKAKNAVCGKCGAMRRGTPQVTHIRLLCGAQ